MLPIRLERLIFLLFLNDSIIIFESVHKCPLINRNDNSYYPLSHRILAPEPVLEVIKEPGPQ